ncbi:transcription factor HES-2-like, partial [Bufo gargarizans]|uniref:transcription factor HES-2-like n=1 Tax=Bufo gargarizans TaxID=30331 RepID=UPI001CF29F86
CPAQATNTKMRNTYLSKDDKKLMKPVIEKRRRDRINQSLENLRTLLLDATQDESLKNPKTEKADILKKTVQFLKLCHNSGPEDAKKATSGFNNGFQEGLSQATNFISSRSTICEKKRDYVVGKLCQHIEERSPNEWEESASDDSFCVDQSQLIPSPPQISRIPEHALTMNPERLHCQPFLHYPSPTISTEAQTFGQVQQSSTHKSNQSILQANSCRKSVQRTLFPPVAPSPVLSSTLVWRPWP